MAGGDGDNLRDSSDYHYDASKYKGFWKYYNSETPTGRASASAINIGSVFAIGVFIYFYKKYQKNKLQETPKQL